MEGLRYTASTRQGAAMAAIQELRPGLSLTLPACVVRLPSSVFRLHRLRLRTMQLSTSRVADSALGAGTSSSLFSLKPFGEDPCPGDQ